MAKIGFTTEREFEPQQLVLHHYKTYGRNVQYQVEINGTKASVYLPLDWFKGNKYPARVMMAVAVPEKTPWDKD